MERRGTMRPGGAMVVRTEISSARVKARVRAPNDARTPAARVLCSAPCFRSSTTSDARCPRQVAALWHRPGMSLRLAARRSRRSCRSGRSGGFDDTRRTALAHTPLDPARCGHGLCQLRASPARSRAMCLEERRAPRMRAPKIRRQDPVPPRPTGRQAAQRRGQCQPGGF